MKYRVLYTTLLAVASLFAIGCDSTPDDEIIEPSQPVVLPSDSIPADPTEPQPTEPQPTEPQPTEPQPTEPQPTEPQPTEPQPTEPQPTEPQPTEPQPEPTIETLLTESKINGVWTGSDGAKYYFYTTYNAYIVNGTKIETGVWSFTQSTKTLTIGPSSSVVKYAENPETMTFEGGLVLTKTTESLPDESRYLSESKELTNSVGNMSSVTWVPEEVPPFEI